jgi:uncharacterized protein YcbK (DUF882 family)
MYNYFNKTDFNNCDPPCDIKEMQIGAMKKFDQAREIAGIPFIITSAFRTPEHDRKMGRSGNSAHTRGTALDIRATDSNQRFLIVNALIKVGCKRIGIHNRFVHADFDNQLPDQVFWLY